MNGNNKNNPYLIFYEYFIDNGYNSDTLYDEGKAALLYLTDGTVSTNMKTATELYKNRIIRSFLVAYFFVNAIEKIGMDKRAEIESLNDERAILYKIKYIFASDINHMISYYVQTLDESNLNTLFESLKFLFESTDTSSQLKINLAFVFGRIRGDVDADVKKEVIIYLAEQFDKLEKKIFDNYRVRNDIKDDQILIYRSISNSLVFQQENMYRKRYFKRLLYDSRLNGLNRAFDILYYGDCPGQLLKKSNLKNVQEKDIQDAVRVLLKRVDNMISEVDYRMRLSLDLEIMTLYSIAEHHIEDLTLLSSTLDELICLAKKIHHLSDERMIDPLVIHFVSMVEEILSSEKPYRDIFNELLYSKNIFRTQWQEYGVERDESMMEHIYSSFVIGEFCLPNSYEELKRDFQLTDGRSYDAYNKDRILNIILFSHLGNAYSGPYYKKTNEDRIRENERYSYYAMLTTIPYIYGLGSNKDFWNEYYEDVTINSKIARDICHLENLIQAFSFKNDQKIEEINVPDIYRMTMGQLQTSLVKEICNKIRKNVID